MVFGTQGSISFICNRKHDIYGGNNLMKQNMKAMVFNPLFIIYTKTFWKAKSHVSHIYLLLSSS
jgi:lysozyme family protein